jgi:hypothetical protein
MPNGENFGHRRRAGTRDDVDGSPGGGRLPLRFQVDGLAVWRHPVQASLIILDVMLPGKAGSTYAVSCVAPATKPRS